VPVDVRIVIKTIVNVFNRGYFVEILVNVLNGKFIFNIVIIMSLSLIGKLLKNCVRITLKLIIIKQLLIYVYFHLFRPFIYLPKRIASTIYYNIIQPSLFRIKLVRKLCKSSLYFSSVR